jgi:hypothetical protein
MPINIIATIAKPIPAVPSGPGCSLAKTMANATVIIKNSARIGDAADTSIFNSDKLKNHTLKNKQIAMISGQIKAVGENGAFSLNMSQTPDAITILKR